MLKLNTGKNIFCKKLLYILVIITVALTRCGSGCRKTLFIDITSGLYSSEIRVTIKQDGVTLKSVPSGNRYDIEVSLDVTKPFIIIGSDTFGDGWNGAQLRIYTAKMVNRAHLYTWEGPAKIQETKEVWLKEELKETFFFKSLHC